MVALEVYLLVSKKVYLFTPLVVYGYILFLTMLFRVFCQRHFEDNLTTFP